MVSRLLVAFALLFLPSAALAQWKVAETRNFIIYSESSNERIEKLAERLESYDKLMRMATNIHPEKEPVKVRIYEVPGVDDIGAALGMPDQGIAGFYRSNVFGPYLVTPRQTRLGSPDFTPELVLQHEYAHHFMLQYFPAVYPSWYTEGFAELIGSSKMLPDGKIGYGMPAKHRGNEIAAYWVPLQELLTKERVRFLDTYGQGWAMTHYFTFNNERARQLRQYLLALQAGKSLPEAAQVFGNLDALNRDARRYVTRGSFEYKPVAVEIARPVIQSMRALSAAEAVLIPEIIAFRDGDLSLYRKDSDRDREARKREENLKRVRAKTAHYPTDPFGLLFLAEAESVSGNFTEAMAAVDRLLAIRPTHVRGLAHKSLLLSQQASRLQGAERTARAEQARDLAVRANRLDPEDPMPLVAYYQTYNRSGEKVPALAVEGLEQALSVLPGDSEIRLMLVNQLEADGRYSDAIRYLLPLSNSLHDSPLRAAAREQMERLQAKLGARRAA